MEDKYSPEKLRRVNIRRFYFLFLIFALSVIFYYFGEIADFFGWEFLRLNFFYGVHDVHRLIFLFPIMYAAYYFGMKATIIMIILMISAFMPRALFISPYPDPLLRATLFTVIAALVGLFIARESESRIKIGRYMEKAREQYLKALDEVRDGVLLIGPDYRIRFLNDRMKQRFGDGMGLYCYSYLHKKSTPCQQICRLSYMRDGAAIEMEYELTDGGKYQVVVLPYIDTDGAVCQLSVIKNVADK